MGVNGHAFSSKNAEFEPRSSVGTKWRRIVRLLDVRKRVVFAMLTGARIGVGFCDLALAAAMYLLFMLLQNGAPPTHSGWAPKTALTATLLAAIVLVIRALADILSSARRPQADSEFLFRPLAAADAGLLRNAMESLR